MIVKLLTELHLEFLSLKGGCRGSSESTLVKMSNCWKSHAAAQFFFWYLRFPFQARRQIIKLITRLDSTRKQMPVCHISGNGVKKKMQWSTFLCVCVFFFFVFFFRLLDFLVYL